MTKQRDPIVEVSLTCLRRAVKCLERGDKYNNETITLADYFPNGIEDHAVKVKEALFRLYALQTAGEPMPRLMQEAEDVLGHIALGLAHIVMGLNKGKLSLEIERLGAGLYVGRKDCCVKDQYKSGEAPDDMDGNDSSGCGSRDRTQGQERCHKSDGS